MSQYHAPGRDGAYIPKPGREHPAYPETESLMMMDELEKDTKSEMEEEDPFRPASPDEFMDEGSEAEGYDDPYGNYRDQGDGPPSRVLPVPPKEGFDSDSDDDLMFDEDREEYERNQGTEEVDEEEGAKQWKYSTAGIKQRGIWVKYCCIALMFLIMACIFAAISYFFEKLFQDPGPPDEPERLKRPDNATWPFEKDDIDQSCNSNALAVDRAVKCQEYCEPRYSACCDPFPLTKSYNFSAVDEALNYSRPEEFEYPPGDDLFHLNNCQAGDNLRGCASYAKCAALKGVLEPAPVSLPQQCNEEGLALDPGNCESICRKARCCFDEQGLSCLTENFEVCMDYAPCQNLRQPNNAVREILPIAPADLDELCWSQLESCNDHCEKARCCTDPNSRCLQENFVACLTYAACEDAPSAAWNITIPPMYNLLPVAPAEMEYACGELDVESEALREIIQPGSCAEYCEQAACCFQDNPGDNCFHEDPLGCYAYFFHCQHEPVVLNNWFIGTYRA